MFKGINAIEFGKRFYDNESCYLYLIEQKWCKGFSCSRCGHERYYKGKTYYHRKCRSCPRLAQASACAIIEHKL
jgi:hypothetical protein